MSSEGFWQDQAKAGELIKELKSLKAEHEPWVELEDDIAQAGGLIEIVEPDDRASIEDIAKDVAALERRVSEFQLKFTLSGEADKNNAIMSINAGAGGTESCDWVSMLLRMFTRWAQDKGHEVQMVDILPGEEAGIKNVTIIINGPYAYGYLQSESGVHRLVRISPFDSNKRRHTSFASVDVIPEISDKIEIEIEDNDLRVDVYRSGGHGGQSVNTTDSAVRITHLPSGIVVQCQDERSQYKNKQTAMKVLKARLYEREREETKKKMQNQYSEKSAIAWGSQIRSYVMHPYSMVKDHRTDYETSNVTAVMDGALDNFMEHYLKWKAAQSVK
ncbi:MAG: peptide chain release factor 2 [Candidatus Omnitrophica bacterium CG1_02_49_10]|nr:MAG: peptide chain release factor 2 [Candidatus Omnitrophica bacterium CG1_02_49_10]